jgi:hypothetical protein
MRTKYAVVVIPFLLLMLSSVTNASLDVGVSVEYPKIDQFQSQEITVTTNERGKGILLVIQPAEGTPWIDFLNDHPGLKALWNMLPNKMRTKIASRVGGKIVSFDIISTDLGGGSETVTFPEDLTGINGDPSTALTGEYKVVFAFISWERSNDDGSRCCCLFELDFGCGSWFVIPEVPVGTIISVLSMMAAIPVFKFRKRIRIK